MKSELKKLDGNYSELISAIREVRNIIQKI